MSVEANLNPNYIRVWEAGPPSPSPPPKKKPQTGLGFGRGVIYSPFSLPPLAAPVPPSPPPPAPHRRRSPPFEWNGEGGDTENPAFQVPLISSFQFQIRYSRISDVQIAMEGNQQQQYRGRGNQKNQERRLHMPPGWKKEQ